MSMILDKPTETLTGTWQVDPVHSQVGFAVDYLGGTFRGTFAPVEGILDISEDGIRLAGSARAEAIHVQDENLTAHLLSPDFFDVERTPDLSFASGDVSLDGDKVVIRGELTIKGHTEPVTLTGNINGPVTDPYGRERLIATLTGAVDRTSFGLDWNAPLPNGEPALSNEVTLNAELYLVKDAAEAPAEDAAE